MQLSPALGGSYIVRFPPFTAANNHARDDGGKSEGRLAPNSQ
jgi:hypothetical protein